MIIAAIKENGRNSSNKFLRYSKRKHSFQIQTVAIVVNKWRCKWDPTGPSRDSLGYAATKKSSWANQLQLCVVNLTFCLMFIHVVPCLQWLQWLPCVPWQKELGFYHSVSQSENNNKRGGYIAGFSLRSALRRSGPSQNYLAISLVKLLIDSFLRKFIVGQLNSQRKGPTIGHLEWEYATANAHLQDWVHRQWLSSLLRLGGCITRWSEGIFFNSM